MQRNVQAAYSAGNLLILVGIILVSASIFSLIQVSGLLRTGFNLLSSLLIILGAIIPVMIKNMETGQRMRSIGLRCFTSSFILSILLTVQTILEGWASTVPVLASLALALSGIVTYLISGRGGRVALPCLRDVMLLVSVVIIFSTPIIQLSLAGTGLNTDVARIISISLLIVFTIILYFSLKGFSGKIGFQLRQGEKKAGPS